MQIRRIDYQKRFPEHAFERLLVRDAAIWTDDVAVVPWLAPDKARLLALTWRFALTESKSSDLARSLEQEPFPVLARIRGPIFVIAGNPDERDIPKRSLPVFFLNGRDDAKDRLESSSPGALQAQRRRLNMTGQLIDARVPLLVVVPGVQSQALAAVMDLWTSGDLQSEIVVVNPDAEIREQLENWIASAGGPHTLTICDIAPTQLLADLETRLADRTARTTVNIRIKTPLRRETELLDITQCESLTAPLLDRFGVIRSSDLLPILPSELTDSEIDGFFDRSLLEFSAEFWKPFAAGLPWDRDERFGEKQVLSVLAEVEREGADQNRLLLLDSEPGAGGTTQARKIAFGVASAGYPVLVASQSPFTADAEEVGRFLYAVHQEHLTQLLRGVPGEVRPEASADDDSNETKPQVQSVDTLMPSRKSTPWLIVFDSQHWRGREEALGMFAKKLRKLSRPAVLLVVNEVPGREDFGFPAESLYRVPISHELNEQDVVALGNNINRALAPRKKARRIDDWLQFWRENRVEVSSGSFTPTSRPASFWVGLEFWLKGQLQLGTSIQKWLYDQFRRATYRDRPLSDGIRMLLLRIAAMSIEREAYPEQLIPVAPKDEDPYAAQLEELRRVVPALGLTRGHAGNGWVWFVSHVPLARYLLNSVAEDRDALKELCLKTTGSPIDLRLELLRAVATNPQLATRRFVPLALKFAQTIFKLDRTANLEFARSWRKVLAILEEMPDPIWDTSRTFNHHVAISRRRVATDNQVYVDKTDEEVLGLLSTAIEHLEWALSMEGSQDDERDLNLYNSLARAYQDLAEFKRNHNANEEEIRGYLKKASDFTRRARDEAPTSSYVLETLAHELIQTGSLYSNSAISCACEALDYIHQALTLDTAYERKSALLKAMEGAYRLLLSGGRAEEIDMLRSAGNPLGFVARAWLILSSGGSRSTSELGALPAKDLDEAIVELQRVPSADREWPLVKLQYDLLCARHPKEFEQQLALLDSLEGTPAWTVQLRLERAVLLHLNQRHPQADREFRDLRRLFRDTDAFVVVPRRLQWFINPANGQRLECDGRVVPSSGYKQLAKIRQIGDVPVPFEPLEFGEQAMPIGRRIRCHISFGYAGPYARAIRAEVGSDA